MLNLNFNIIGSSTLGGAQQPFRAGAVYSVRNDPYSASIVVALPGNLFYDGDYQNQFGMTNAWDDISAYVKGNGIPVGSNLTVNATTTGSANISTSPLTLFGGATSKYNSSTKLEGTSSLIVPQSFASGSGTNLSFSSSFVVEAWVAWEVTASATATTFSPNREFIYKYDPSARRTAAYLWYGNYGGNPQPEGTLNVISGSTMFIFDSDVATPAEVQVSGTGSNQIVPYQFKHYAISYTYRDALQPLNDERLRLYIDGVLQRDYHPTLQINQDLAEPLNIFGRIDTGSADYAAGNTLYFNDFRFYNGTNKNYTGSLIPLPESMIVWN